MPNFDMSSGFPGINTHLHRVLSQANQRIASGVPKQLTLKELLMMGDINRIDANSVDLLGGAIRAPEKNVAEHPLVKQILGEAKKESAFKMYEQFLATYSSPLVSGDVVNRLGKVQAVKALKSKSLYTDFFGRMYTRSGFSQAYDIPDNPTQPKVFRRYHYTHLFFPPYAYDGKVDWVRLNSLFVPLKQNETTHSKYYDLKSFQVNRDLLTYRTPAFKAINDSIEYVQFLFEGLTGIVSTYMTEWDLSVYIQEGIIGKPEETATDICIPTISLLYRIKDDNPSLYKDDRAYTYGIINAATSKYSTEAVWDISSYPLSAFWMPRYDNFIESFSDTDGGIPPSYNTDKPFFGFFKQIKYLDAWNALASDWKDWDMRAYKALYNSPDEGLSSTDVDYFMNPDEPVSSSRMMSNRDTDDYIAGKEDKRPILNQAKCIRCWACIAKCPKGCIKPIPIPAAGGFLPLTPGYSGTLMMKLDRSKCIECMKCMEVCIPMKALENPETKRKQKFKNGSSALNKISAAGGGKNGKYATTDDWVSETGDTQLTFCKPIGTPVRNPVYYGGPHGKELSPKSVASSFDQTSVGMRNAPRITHTPLDSDQMARDYFRGLNKFYMRPSLRINPKIASDKEWRDFKSWKTLGHRLNFENTTFEETPQEPAKSIMTMADSCMSPPAALRYLKQGIYEVRPYLTAYSKPVDITVYLGEAYHAWFWYRDFKWWKTTGSYVYNPLLNQSEWQEYSYYGALYSYSYYEFGWRSYSRGWFRGWSFWHKKTVYWQKAKQIHYFYDVAWKYIHHSEPYANWTVAPHKVYSYSYIPGGGWWGLLWGIIGSFWGVRFRGPSLIESYRITNRLTCTSSVVSIRSFNGYTVYYTADEMRVMNQMIRNHRGLSHENSVFLIGPGENPDFVIRASVSVKEYMRSVERYHSHRSHRCHTHFYWMWFEYIDVVFKDNLESFVGLSYVKDNRDNIWSSGLHVDEPTTQYHSLFQYMEGGTTLHGTGIMSSWPGFEPDLPRIPGNEVGFSNSIPNAKDTPLKDLAVPRYVIHKYNTGPALTTGGFVKYGVGNAVEEYKPEGVLPARIRRAFIRAFTSATFFPEGNQTFARVSILWPLRTLWAQLHHQKAFLKMAEEFLPLVDLDGVVQLMIKAIDPKTVKTSIDEDINKVFQKPDFNYWFREAYKALADKNIKVQVMDDIISRKNTINEILTWLEKNNRISKPIEEWSYNEIIKGYEYIGIIENFFLGKDSVVAFFFLYLHVLYEYRKYFISKRFNKSDGTYYILRHLEVLNLIALKTLALEDSPPLDSLMPSDQSYDVVAYDVQNSLKDKMLALVGEHKPLGEDRITNVYIRVEYMPGILTDKDARAFAREQEKLKQEGKPYTELTKTALRPGMDGFDPRKQWAIKPLDGVYRLTSKEYHANEGRKMIKALANKVGSPKDLSKPEIKDIDDCLTSYIVWKDEEGKTPIFKGNLEGIDPAMVARYQANTTPEQFNAYEMLCQCRQTSDYWQVSLLDANLATPRVSGYINEVKLERYDPEKPTSTSASRAASPIFFQQLYPITEEQSVALPGMEQIPEVQKYIQQAMKGIESLDVNLDEIKFKSGVGGGILPIP